MRAVLTFIVMLVTATANAAEVRGELLLQWADSAPGETAVGQVRAQLATDAGGLIELDADAALLAAEDLYALAGQRVAVSMASAKGGGTVIPDYIVPEYSGAKSTQVQTESRPWAVLLCKFADIADEPQAPAYFASMFGPHEGQLGYYWNRMSAGRVQMDEGRVRGWYRLPYARSYYISGGLRLDRLFADCIAAADAEIDFDNGGEGLAGIQLMFNAALDCCAWAGRMRATLDGRADTWRVAWLPPFAYQNVGGLAHEIGHTFGLPHSNNSDGDSDPYDNVWDVMSDSYRHAVHDSLFGRLPKGLNEYQRDRAGWIAPERKRVVGEDEVARIRLAPLTSTAPGVEMVEVRYDSAAPWRYMTVAARSTGEFEDAALPDGAVIMHSIDTTRREPAWSIDADAVAADVSDNEGSMFRVGESYRSGDGRVEVKVLSADATGFDVEVRSIPMLFADAFD